MNYTRNYIPYYDIRSSLQNLSGSFWLLTCIFLAALSFSCTLWLPSVGEEGVYSNITLEMLNQKKYLTPTLFGMQYSRPPLFNWLMLPLTYLFGSPQVLLAARVVNAAATLATAAVLYGLVRRLFTERNFALFSVAIYLSGDLLFKRGWLAYADSLFSLGIFAAIAALWIALDKQQSRWMCVAVLCLIAAFLSKVNTAYLFYGLAGLVLLIYHPNRKFLFSPASWLLHSFATAVPIYWMLYINQGYATANTAWSHYKFFLKWPGLLPYAAKLAFYPVDLWCRFLPASLIALIVAIVAWRNEKPVAPNTAIKIAFWITILNLLPYWLASSSNVRYILPVYPFIALLIAFVIWQASQRVRELAIATLLFAVLLKYIYALAWLPYEHQVWRGAALPIAQDIQRIAGNENLYSNDSSSAGLRIAVELNKLRNTQAPIILPPHNFTGYVIADTFSESYGELIKTYSLGRDKIYLLKSTSVN